VRLPFEPGGLSAAVPHAHLDHSGYLLLLVKSGFRARVYGTAAQRRLKAPAGRGRICRSPWLL